MAAASSRGRKAAREHVEKAVTAAQMAEEAMQMAMQEAAGAGQAADAGTGRIEGIIAGLPGTAEETVMAMVREAMAAGRAEDEARRAADECDEAFRALKEAIARKARASQEAAKAGAEACSREEAFEAAKERKAMAESRASAAREAAFRAMMDAADALNGMHGPDGAERPHGGQDGAADKAHAGYDPDDIIIDFGIYRKTSDPTPDRPGPMLLSQVLESRPGFIEKFIEIQPPTSREAIPAVMRYCARHGIGLHAAGANARGLMREYGVRELPGSGPAA